MDSLVSLKKAFQQYSEEREKANPHDAALNQLQRLEALERFIDSFNEAFNLSLRSTEVLTSEYAE